jgi:hypothetical protein
VPVAEQLLELLPPEMPERFSVSFIGQTGECIFRAVHSRRLRGTGGRFATLGKMSHEVFATLETRAQLFKLTQVDPGEALMIADAVLGNPEEPGAIDYGLYRLVLQQTDIFANAVVFPTDADVWIVEKPFRIPLVDPETGDTFIISGRMDEVAIWGDHYRNRDWKTGPRLPGKKVVQETHTQLPIYAWAALKIWPWLQSFEPEEYYTRHGVGRPVTVMLDDIERIEGFLLTVCRRLLRAYKRNEFTATEGPWCNRGDAGCPVADLCPLPNRVRGDGGLVRSYEEARTLLELNEVDAARIARRRAAVMAFLEGQPVGTVEVNGKQVGYQPVTKRTVNKDKVKEALALVGMTLDDVTDTETSTEFKG